MSSKKVKAPGNREFAKGNFQFVLKSGVTITVYNQKRKVAINKFMRQNPGCEFTVKQI